MHGQLGISSAHRALSDMIAHPSTQLADQLAVDERVDMASVAKVIEAKHTGENPVTTVVLPTE